MTVMFCRVVNPVVYLSALDLLFNRGDTCPPVKSFFKNKLDLTIGIKNIFNETNLNNIISSTGASRSQNAFLYGTSYFAKVVVKI